LLAGLISLFQKSENWPQPKEILFSEKGKKEQISQYFGALEALTIPSLGVFPLNYPPVSSDKFFLLYLGDENKERIFWKYFISLIIGGAFRGGVKWLVDKGIVNLREIDELQLLPDLKKTFNVCLDGELGKIETSLVIFRQSSGIILIVPRRQR
jgi:hypothetical protein